MWYSRGDQIFVEFVRFLIRNNLLSFIYCKSENFRVKKIDFKTFVSKNFRRSHTLQTLQAAFFNHF